MKIIKISFLLLFLSIGISCEKDKEPTITLAQDLQNGFWESQYQTLTIKFDGMNATLYAICESDGCPPNFPCVSFSFVEPYTLEGNEISILNDGDTESIKIVGDILTIGNDTHQRKETLGYPECQ